MQGGSDPFGIVFREDAADTVIQMRQGGEIHRWIGGAWVLALVALCAAVPLRASAAARPGAELSPRLRELSKPRLRSAPAAQQAKRLSLARRGPGSLLRDGGRVLVDVRFERRASTGAERLRGAGAEIVHRSPRYRTVTVGARPAELRALADVAGVTGITEVLEPIVSASSCKGLVTSEGDDQLGTETARSGFNLDGTGVTVGVLSDSFDTDATADTHAAQDVASGDLPGAGNPCGRTAAAAVFQDLNAPGQTIDEGRAMAQVVHDLAPGASLAFATAFTGELGFAGNIRGLAASGAKVIVDDVLYLEEPFFQEGPIGVAASDVLADGVTYLSSAANNNLIDLAGNDIASWEAPSFRDTACPPELEGTLGAEKCMDFDPGPGEDPTFEITVAKGATLTVDLQWAEPWLGVTADLDAFLLDSEDKPIPAGESPVGSFNDNVGGGETAGTQKPVEVFDWENKTGTEQKVRLAINRCFDEVPEEPEGCNPAADPEAKPRLKFALLENGSGVTATEYPESSELDTVGPTIFGHNGGSGVLSVAAVPFNDGSAPEPYSSRGPVTHYFGPADDSLPAPPLAEPEVLAKPDFAASDCGLTTFFLPTSTPGIHRFCGTSAAAPHAAAVVALMREANPSLSVSQIRTALAASARPVGSFGVDAVGAGLLDAFGAVGRVALPPRVQITDPPPALSSDRTPSIGFAANRPASFSCSVDGGTLRPCESPFETDPLSDGTHGFAVQGTDLAGRSGMSETVSFTIDTKPPNTFFRRHPPKVIRTEHRRAKAVFRFGSNEAGASFVCRVDGGPLRVCRARFVRRFKEGRHTLRVAARDRAGNVDRSPARFGFEVRRRGS